MTLQEFDSGLKTQLSGPVFELAAPKGLTRYVVWHSYGAGSLYADDRNQLDAPKVQLDIVTGNAADTLAEDVAAALQQMGLPYTIVSESYDPDYNMRRTILQLVVI